MTSSVCFSEVVLKGERDVNRMEAKVDSQRGVDGGRKNDEEPRTADERAAVQARTFTRWINLVLQRNDPPAAVRDLFKDIRDGRILMALLERLSGSQLVRGNLPLSCQLFSFKHIQAFDLNRKMVDLLSISASGVVDGDPSVVLSLLWSIILHFQVKQVVGGLQEPSSSPPLCSTERPTQTGESGADTLPSKGRQAARESEHHGKTVHALLQRVQRCTSEFGVQVEDFGTSWSSGLAFLALIKSINPTLVDLRESLLREPRENIQQAFTLASCSLGIAPLLEPDDVLSTFIDEPSIITYVSTFFQHCSTTDEDCSGCSEDTEANFGSLGTGFGGNLAIDPEAQALLKCSEKSCEQQLWKKWSRRGSARGNSEEPVGDGASGSKKGRYPNPPSPLNANIASQEIPVSG
ncbi:hypothetical protein fugu_017952 [Takifugu bimaculatus]|uniref:Calponin-homology (CH) domain-containing protein n=1 Tax=Takifugu bimaculatus TaxID=433685 RepID=A0A4Z2BSK3_9TELE|nr:hypothetical protein fugu_017952 [Takifugu bimaculatus]